MIIDDLKNGVLTHSAEEMQALAALLTPALPADALLALHGDLGSGKTTFVQGLGKAWGIDQPLTSPTYTLVNIYRGARLLVHVDAYRLENPQEWNALMIEEWLTSPFCLAIEWPEKLQETWLDSAWHLYFALTAEDAHSVRLVLPGNL